MGALFEMTLISFLKMKGYISYVGILSSRPVLSVLSNLKYYRGERASSTPFLIVHFFVKVRLFTPRQRMKSNTNQRQVRLNEMFYRYLLSIY